LHAAHRYARLTRATKASTYPDSFVCLATCTGRIGKDTSSSQRPLATAGCSRPALPSSTRVPVLLVPNLAISDQHGQRLVRLFRARCFNMTALEMVVHSPHNEDSVDDYPCSAHAGCTPSCCKTEVKGSKPRAYTPIWVYCYPKTWSIPGYVCSCCRADAVLSTRGKAIVDEAEPLDPEWKSCQQATHNA
jgi:hypothetical protein